MKNSSDMQGFSAEEKLRRSKGAGSSSSSAQRERLAETLPAMSLGMQTDSW